jgi:hypothetical protein
MSMILPNKYGDQRSLVPMSASLSAHMGLSRYYHHQAAMSIGAAGNLKLGRPRSSDNWLTLTDIWWAFLYSGRKHTFWRGVPGSEPVAVAGASKRQ